MFRKILSKKNSLFYYRLCHKQVNNEVKKDIAARLLTLSGSKEDVLNAEPAIKSIVEPKVRASFTDLAKAVTPLCHLPYKEQLKLKDEKNLKLMMRLTEKLKPNRNSGEIICQLKDTIPSPVTDNYRNKDEFHIRYNSEGRMVVGLCVGKGFNGTLEILSPEGLINTKPTHWNIANYFSEYLNRDSDWKACMHFEQGGNWRYLIVRSNLLGELMLIVVVHPQQLTEEEIHSEMLKVKEYLLSYPSGNIKSIYYQVCPHTRCTVEQSPYVLLHGDTHIYEQIGDYKFRISPESFFQVNTEAARVLYGVVAEQLKPNRMSTLLDLCCGTGTQGISLARMCRGVIGIELSTSAVLDARFNASLNDIHNTEFFAGRAEIIFKKVLEQLETAPEICAIVNPPRGGMDSRVIEILRNNERVRNLVYVSCQADGPAMKNFLALCQRPNKKIQSQPFQLKRAIPVDMFPHTTHCEMVLSFHR